MALFTMMMLAITAMLIGTVLGLRFTVIILFPAIIIGSAATFAIGMARSDSLLSILLAIVMAITMLQMGYLGGTFIRFGIAAHASKRNRPKSIAVAQTPAR
jgi:hypothetical protein